MPRVKCGLDGTIILLGNPDETGRDRKKYIYRERQRKMRSKEG
jgi:hypothetical protein